MNVEMMVISNLLPPQSILERMDGVLCHQELARQQATQVSGALGLNITTCTIIEMLPSFPLI